MNEGKLKAVHDDDLESLLDSLGCLKGITEGEYKCEFCDTTVNLENIAAVFPLNGKICFCCNDEDCYNIMLKRGDKVNKNDR